MKQLTVALLLIALSPAGLADSWKRAEENGKKTQQVIKFCNRYAHGWLSHADPISGLLPRRLQSQKDFHWNAKDCAADNYPFIVLTAYVTDNYYLKQITRTILAQEQRLTNRLGPLPDDFDFATQKFRTEKYKLDDLIFGASEYAKDGLMPVIEWMGPGPWLDRMEELVRGIWKHAPYETAVGRIPSKNVEVNGELLQNMSRLYWITGDDAFKEWCFRLCDYYLLHNSLLELKQLRLRDHGCEIVAGLSEAYVIASRKDPQRWKKYRPAMHAILDRILECGVNKDGLMYDAINPRTGKVTGKRLSDGWGYVYNAFLTVAMIDGESRFREAPAHALANINKYRDHAWEGTSADGYADSIEGAIYMVNRIPDESAGQWIDSEINFLFKKQRHDGILEGWYGDGNSARTAIMYGLWKTQGITIAPWREDLMLGAVGESDGTVKVFLRSEWAWSGRVRFDKPRHKVYFHMPLDYPRLNQFPEWFTVMPDDRCEVRTEGGPTQTVSGKDLYNYSLALKENETVLLTITKK